MPHYDYQCENCRNIFEVFQKITDEPIKFCPSCNGKVRRLISGGAGIIFKGSGFHKTDYANSKARSDRKTKDSTNSKCANCAINNTSASTKA